MAWPRWDARSASGVRGLGFARAWAEAGHDVRIVTDLRAPPAQDGLPVERLALFHEPRDLHRLPGTARRLRRALGRHRPDVVVTSTPLPTLAIFVQRACRAAGVPCVVDVRDLAADSLAAIAGRRKLRHRALARVERRLYRDADALLAVGGRMAATLVARGARPERVFVAQNGHDVARAVRARPGGPEVVFLGYLLDAVVRRPLELVEAFARVQRIRPATRFAFLGWTDGHDGASQAVARAVRQAIADSGLTEAVDLEPPVAHDDVPRRLARARVGVLPLADRDVFRTAVGAKFYEYVGCGLPVAALGPAGGSELEDHVAGWRVGRYATDASGLAEALVTILDDARLQRRLAAAARRAAPQLRRNAVAKRVLAEVLEPVVRRQGPGPNTVRTSNGRARTS